MMCHFWAQNGPFAMKKFSLVKTIIITFVYLSVLFIVQNLIWANYSYLSTCQKSKSNINLLMKYWKRNTEISLDKEAFLAITWESHFSQACSFCRLMNHKNFHFTQIPDKTNDMIFLKSPKTMFLGHFWPFSVIFARWGFFPKIPALSHITNTMLDFRKN